MIVKTKDVFLVDYHNYNKEPKRHYFYCIYTQNEDKSNKLNSDVIGLLITTNTKFNKIMDDYNVKIKINTKECFVCCDKIFRFSNEEILDVKGDLLDDNEKFHIERRFERFTKEIRKQLK